MGNQYVMLAESVKDVKDLTIGLMDVSVNEIPDADVPKENLPVIIFYPKGGTIHHNTIVTWDQSDHAYGSTKMLIKESLTAWLVANSDAHQKFYPHYTAVPIEDLQPAEKTDQQKERKEEVIDLD